MLALLCGGQGLLSPQMFDLVNGRPEAEAIFSRAAALLGGDPRALVRGQATTDLQANRINQILSVTAALTTHACIAASLPERLAVAGYSVGEMAAFAIAGVWAPETALDLTDRRARSMDAGGSGGQLGYVRGLGRRAVERLLEPYGCAMAIVDPDRLFVFGGDRAAVEAACHEAMAQGAAKAALLDVRIASHTPKLAGAVAPFLEALRSAPWRDPGPGRRLLSGGDGGAIFKTSTALPRLAAQVAHTVDWAAALEALGEFGVTQVLDLGPGHALADMARAAIPGARSYAASAFRTLEGLSEWLGSD